MNNYTKSYIRKGTYPVDWFLDKVDMNHTKRDVVDIDGDLIKLGSDRYKCFKNSGTKCVKCGIEGQFFAKEKMRKSKAEIYHMNLYAKDENGNDVLMTKDHILPKFHGGEDTVDNYQTMCDKCNSEKGHLLSENLIYRKKQTRTMKFIKLYEEFELRKSFSDWVKDPKSKEGVLYEFRFPIKKVKSFSDDGMYSTSELFDMIYNESFESPWRWLAGEMSDYYNSDRDDDSEEEEDREEEELSEEDLKNDDDLLDNVFNAWLGKRGNRFDNFLQMWDLKDKKTDLDSDDYDAMVKDFNSCKLEKYCDEKSELKLQSIRLVTTENYENDIEEACGEIVVGKELSDSEIISLANYITGQCSDGWGEGFEQQEDTEREGDFKFYTSMKPWWHEDDWRVTIYKSQKDEPSEYEYGDEEFED